MSLIRKHGAVLQAWACLDLVLDFYTAAHVPCLLPCFSSVQNGCSLRSRLRRRRR